MDQKSLDEHFAKRTVQFRNYCKTSGDLFEQKNKNYGDAIRFTGVLGASIELIGAVARLPQLVLRAPGHGQGNKEALKDVLKDIHNYAVIALIMMEEENWDGILL